jgi:hypothetical protein
MRLSTNAVQAGMAACGMLCLSVAYAADAPMLPPSSPDAGTADPMDTGNARSFGVKDMVAPQQPHRQLAMAYMENLARFTSMLVLEPGETQGVEPALARTVVAEMRRSFDQMRLHHRDQLRAMDTDTAALMLERAKRMDAQHAVISNQIEALGLETQGGVMNPARMSEHARKVLQGCDGMLEADGMPVMPMTQRNRRPKGHAAR